MLILGIDPGSRKTGFGLIRREGRRFCHVENGTLYLEGQPDYVARLVLLHQEILRLVRHYKVQALAVENIFYHKNPKSVQKLGEVRGVVLMTAGLCGLELGEYTPLQVKQAVTGYGKATKDQVQVMIGKILGLKDRPEENASDALGIALCHAQQLQGSHFLAAGPDQVSRQVTQAKEWLKKSRYFKR